MTRRFVPLITALLLIPCALSSAPQTKTPTLSMRGYPAVGAPPQIKLLKPGEEPRTHLRYNIEPNHASRLNVRITGWTSVTERVIPAKPATTNDMPIRDLMFGISSSGAAPDGTLSFSVAFDEYLLSGGDNPVLFRSGDGIFPLKAQATLSTRGVLQLSAFAMPEPVAQLIGQVDAPLQHLAIPLPEEAVGAGARWEVRQAMAVAGPGMLRVVGFQRTEYEVVVIDGDTVALKYWVEQTAPRQVLDDLGLRSKLDVRKMLSGGSGTVAVHLRTPVPVSESTLRPSMLGINQKKETAVVSGYLRTAMRPAGLSPVSAWIDLKALAGLTSVNLSGSAGSRIGPEHICYPAPDARAAISSAFGGILAAANETLETSGIEATPRSKDFLTIDAQVRDTKSCSAVITVELRRGLGPLTSTYIASNGEDRVGWIDNPAVWRRSFEISGSPIGFRNQVIERLKEDLKRFVADVARANGK